MIPATAADPIVVEPAPIPGPPPRLPSGRSVVVVVGDGREEVQVRAPEGEVEVRILLGGAVPEVRLRSARLAIEAADSVAIEAREFRVRTREDIHLDGAFIRLNCAGADAGSGADQHGEVPQDDHASVDGRVAHPGGGQAADQHGGAAHGDHVGRADAHGHVGGPGGG